MSGDVIKKNRALRTHTTIMNDEIRDIFHFHHLPDTGNSIWLFINTIFIKIKIFLKYFAELMH